MVSSWEIEPTICSWLRDVALSLIPLFGDPELIIYLMKVTKQFKISYEVENAREFYLSLRTNQEERWKRLAELSRKRKFHLMNSSVPVTCTLPFDGGMWRRSKVLLQSIKYFREKLMWKPVQPHETRYLELSLKEKILSVNAIYNESPGSLFRAGFSIRDFDDVVNEFSMAFDFEEALPALILYPEPRFPQNTFIDSYFISIS
jgi:hypothetical protein